MKISVFIVVLCVASVVTGVSLRSSGASENGLSPSENNKDVIPSWRTPMYCGVNSVYALLKLENFDVEHDDVERKLPTGKDGSTIKDMNDVLHAFGLNSRIVRATPEQLLHVELPVIAHLDDDSLNKFEYQSRGHFVVLVGVSAGSIQYIDGTSGNINNVSDDVFMRQWSGLLIIQSQLVPSLVFVLLIFATSATIGFLVLFVTERTNVVSWLSIGLNRDRCS